MQPSPTTPGAAPTQRTPDKPTRDNSVSQDTRTASAPPNRPVAAATLSPKEQLPEDERAERLKASRQLLQTRYVADGKDYRFRANPSAVAFRDDGNRLSTQREQPAIVQSLVAAAELKGWRSMRLTGSEAFKREAWLEASRRGIKAIGYEPTNEDREQLERGRSRSSPTKTQDLQPSATPSREAALTLMERIIKRNPHLSAELRERVMAEGRVQSARNADEGRSAQVRVVDPSAPRASPRQVSTLQPTQDRAARSR